MTSVVFADEIIVVDANSSDQTATLCQHFGKKVTFISTDDWPGFGPQKNRALAYATGRWVLSIDADERVDTRLRDAIAALLPTTSHSAFRIRRCSQFLGRWMTYSWANDYVVRLFKRDCARFSDDLVHEQVQVFQGTLGTIETPLWHYSFSSLEEVIEKMNRYSSAKARMYYQQGQTASLTKAILHGLWTFFRSYILKCGFLEGRQGFILAVANAEGCYYRYLKLLHLQQQAVDQDD